MQMTFSPTQPLVLETAWEVCNQVGGIYTVIRSKIPAMIEQWNGNYCTLGPYLEGNNLAEFEPTTDYNDPFGQAVLLLRERGIDAHYGTWLVTGKPKTVLLNPQPLMERLPELRHRLWQQYYIPIPADDDLLNQVVAFSYLVEMFCEALLHTTPESVPVVGHFHEWMAGLPLLGLRRQGARMRTVFTTHATLLGRYLAMNSPEFYEHLSFFDWEYEAKHFGIEAQVRIERACAHATHVLTTVSQLTAQECRYLLGRTPDVVTPNGLNLERFIAWNQANLLHQQYKDVIHRFVSGHFFHSQPFDLRNTLYFFTSGRYEYHNKGFDITLEALAQLNERMKNAQMDTTVVMFFITRRPYRSPNPYALNNKVLLDEIKATCQAIEKQVGDRLFYKIVSEGRTALPNLNDLVEEYWQLRLRRSLQAWRSNRLPLVVTHNLVNENDEILEAVRQYQLVNKPTDKVKVVYHPDFVSPQNPFFSLDYGQFVRGCNLGIFPSYYEPWGYTPLECIASGTAAITSDLAGFGDYVQSDVPHHLNNGVYINARRWQSYEAAARQLTDILWHFVHLSREERVVLRNNAERLALHFDWSNFRRYYDVAYRLALQ